MRIPEIHDADPVNTLGSRMGEMFDEERVARLVRADCRSRPFALVLIGDGGRVTMVKMYATIEARDAALPVLKLNVGQGFCPMDSLAAMRSMDSFVARCLDR